MTVSEAPAGRPREIWTRLTVDPLADPLARWLAPQPHVTPNRVTLVAFGLAMASAACFLTGQYRLGGLLFALRFFCDCLDGKVSRLQHSSSERGAVLDIAADVVGIHTITACLAWRLVDTGHLHPGVGVALLAVVGVYNWCLGHRKRLAGRAGLGEGGARHGWDPQVPLVRQWVRWSRRLNMSAIPWVLEAEIAMLALAPLLLDPDGAATVLTLGLAFYVVATLVNLRRVLRLADLLDEAAWAAGGRTA